jgi:hypothetical protein
MKIVPVRGDVFRPVEAEAAFWHSDACGRFTRC